MSKPLQIGIDVDLTWVDSGSAWLAWLEKAYGIKVDWDLPPKLPDGALHYNLTKYFPPPGPHQLSGMAFWEETHLYDTLLPREGAVDALEALVKAGHFAHFISMCKKGHFSSKVRNIERHTAHFMDLEPHNGHGFYATKNKGMLKVDVIIDDRNSFLNQFGGDVIKIKFDTPYSQDEGLIGTPDLVTADWTVIKDFILDLA
ncbi:hypothetical protein pEaSNUABM56_00209 [Erwinia phage pEa_SNUABM_56]|nr:hypothetical protein pEaSNUABM55_00137 [Erwinia phage pEa_SNUABM_55]UYL85229.1 hypothetical protein pEaSNUABM56_00209 [Erwinia phage pEa_SNUABM_56]